MYKIIISLITFLVLSISLSASIDESESGTPTVDYSLIALEKVYLQIYSSGLYETHRQQMQDFVNDFDESIVLSAEEEKLKNFILAPLPETDVEKAFYHTELINLIRNICRDINQHSPFLDAYVLWLFTQPDLRDHTAEVMKARYGFDEAQSYLIYENAPTSLTEMGYKYLAALKVPANTNVEDEYAIDPLLYGDMPSYQFTLKNTKVMRLPNMARDYLYFDHGQLKSGSTINEEFYHYLKVLKSRQEKQLYINLMGRKQEFKKTNEIETLERDPLVKDTIIVITQDRSKSSEFYMQNGPYKELDDAARFKETFLNEMKDPNGGYYWSEKINKEEWFSRLDLFVEEIHSTYFESSEQLTQEERMIFIELTSIKIVNELVEMFQPHYLNISCKNTVDRGPTFYTLVYADRLLKKGKPIQQMAYDLLSKIYTPPVLLHNRNAHFYRAVRFDSTLNRLVRDSGHGAPIMP